MQCVNDGKPARYQCTACGRLLCEECIRHVAFQRTTVELCPACGNPVRQAGAKPLSEKSFWYYLFTAFYYPLTGKGPLVLFVNWLFVGIGLAVAFFALVGFFPAGVFGLALAYGYVYFLLFSVIQKTALGEDEPPTTPDVDNLLDLFPSLFKVVMLFAVWTAPTIIFSHLADQSPKKLMSFEAAGQLLGGPGTLWSYIIGPGHTDVVRFLAGLGAFLPPMSLLAVATFNSLRGLHPAPILITIMRVPMQYIVCCAVFYLVLVIREVLWVAVAEAE